MLMMPRAPRANRDVCRSSRVMWAMPRRAQLAWTVVVLIVWGVHPAVGALRSPWDAPVPLVPAHAHCPDPPVLSPDLATADYYRDAAHSVVDPARLAAYEQEAGPLREAARRTVDMADRFRATGDPAEGECVARWLARFAADGVLTGRMSTNRESAQHP